MTVPRCTACGHLALLHAPIGGVPREGDKCVVCQCAGLQTEPEQGKDNSVRERAEGGG